MGRSEVSVLEVELRELLKTIPEQIHSELKLSWAINKYRLLKNKVTTSIILLKYSRTIYQSEIIKVAE